MHYAPLAQGKIPPLSLAPGRDLLVACPHFALERHRYVDMQTLITRPTSFEIWTVLEGEATVAGERLRPGDSLVLPAVLGSYAVMPHPSATLLRCYIPDLEPDLLAPLRALGHPAVRIAQTVR